jgi:hypothetical protein
LGLDGGSNTTPVFSRKRLLDRVGPSYTRPKVKPAPQQANNECFIVFNRSEEALVSIDSIFYVKIPKIGPASSSL